MWGVMFQQEDAAQAIESIHNDTLSSDPLKACGSRLAKRVAGVLESWIADERERGTDPQFMVRAAPHVAVMLMLTAIVNNAKPGSASRVAQLLRPFWHALYEEAMKSLEQDRATDA